jgi:hypothetical protein
MYLFKRLGVTHTRKVQSSDLNKIIVPRRIVPPYEAQSRRLRRAYTLFTVRRD